MKRAYPAHTGHRVRGDDVLALSEHGQLVKTSLDAARQIAQAQAEEYDEDLDDGEDAGDEGTSVVSQSPA